jgi:hypothetical protein
MLDQQKTTDTIPRVSVDKILKTLDFVASIGGKTSFEQVRLYLAKHSDRLVPASATAMWKTALDSLSELKKLGFMTVGVLPNKKSLVLRNAETPCQITEAGGILAELYRNSRGKAFDEMMLAWLRSHTYFRAFIIRLQQQPLFVPDVTSVKQLGPDALKLESLDLLASRIADNCIQRLKAIDFPQEKGKVLVRVISERLRTLGQQVSLTELGSKQWVDAIQDRVVIPAFLAAESLPFDAVTFQHVIRASKDFFAASITTAYPDYSLRVIFATCDFYPDVKEDPDQDVKEVSHHGKTYASSQFIDALINAYQRLSGAASVYVDAYSLRAVVCLQLMIQPQVFEACLKQAMDRQSGSEVTVYTELPFDPPPPGEDYVEVDGNRIGLIKLAFNQGG